MSEELRFHLEKQIAANIASGIAPPGFHGTVPFVETQGYLPLSVSSDQAGNS